MTSGIKMNVRVRVGELTVHGDFESEGITALIGPNGAGKSTLLKTLLGELTPQRGSISVADEPLFCSERAINVPIQDRRLGYVPQRFALFPHLSVADNIGFGLFRLSAGDRNARVAKLLDDFGLAGLSHRKPANLSGGESQRVAMARALAISPRALLLDEPMSALDATAKKHMRELLAETLATLALPTLLVTHDVADVAALSGRVAVLEAGEIAQIGTLQELRDNPVSAFVSELVNGSD